MKPLNTMIWLLVVECPVANVLQHILTLCTAVKCDCQPLYITVINITFNTNISVNERHQCKASFII